MPRERVVEAARAWAGRLRQSRPEVVRVGYFGSYARDEYVPGSDFDVMIEVTSTPYVRRADRAAEYLADDFPVGLEVFVYTTEELRKLRFEGSSFIAAVDREVEWIG